MAAATLSAPSSCSRTPRGAAAGRTSLSNLGAALRASGRVEEAEAAYREAIARAPDFPSAHGNLGNLLQGRGRLAEAEVALRRASELSPNDPQVLRSFGLCLMRYAQGA